MADLRRWLKEGAHLPKPLRDFHDQKAVFKSIDSWAAKPADPRPVNWIAAHCYTVDYFLRFMASHGWTLQRSRVRVGFASLEETLRVDRDRDLASFQAARRTEVAP